MDLKEGRINHSHCPIVPLINTEADTEAQTGRGREGLREERSCAEAEPLHASARRVEQTPIATQTLSPLSYMHSHTQTACTHHYCCCHHSHTRTQTHTHTHIDTHTNRNSDGCQAQWEASRQEESLKRKRGIAEGKRRKENRVGGAPCGSEGIFLYVSARLDKAICFFLSARSFYQGFFFSFSHPPRQAPALSTYLSPELNKRRRE